MDGVDLAETLDDLRIVLEPYCQEADIEVRWDIPPALPAVWVWRCLRSEAGLNTRLS